jgi:hypothetical protein
MEESKKQKLKEYKLYIKQSAKERMEQKLVRLILNLDTSHLRMKGTHFVLCSEKYSSYEE